MQRRELLQWIAAVTGQAFVGVDALFAAADTGADSPYSPAQVAFFDDVADTIMPRTDSPGARDAGVGPYIARYSAACYPPEHISLLKTGLSDIAARMQKLSGQDFGRAEEQQRVALLTEIDQQAKEHAHAVDGKPGEHAPHYFTLMKQLTLIGYFTSELGATHLSRYRPIPGRYQGCVPYRGEAFWAW